MAEALSQFFKHPVAGPPTTQLAASAGVQAERGVSSVPSTLADPGVGPPATADSKPNASEPTTNASMANARSGSDPAALAEARTLRPSRRSIWAAAAASAGLFAMLLVAVAVYLRSGQDRGTSPCAFSGSWQNGHAG